MENILIKFEADTVALDEISQKLGTVKQSMAGLVTGSATSIAKTPGGSTVSNTKAVDDLTKANQKLTKSNDDLLKKYDEVSKKYNATQSTVKTAANDSKKSIEALSISQKKVNDQLGNKAATESFREQMKKLKYEIIALDLAGQNGSETYNKLVQKAGEMNDAMKDTGAAISNAGSDTQAFDAILAGTELIAGGFSVATGAAALFGVGSEDVARIQVRLQSAIAITTGLQSVGNAIQKDGALIQGIVKAQLWARATAEKLATSGTWAGVAAQKAFNLVAMANPYILMAVALMTVVGAIWAFNAGSDAEADKQKRINELEALRIQSLELLSNSYKDAGAEREKSLANELELLKASGASQGELAKAERSLASERLTNAARNAGLHTIEIAALEENKQKVEDIQKAMIALEQAKANGQKYVSFTIGMEAKTIKIDDKAKEDLQSQLDGLTTVVTIGTDAKESAERASQEFKVLAEKQKVDAVKNARSESSAVAEIKLIQAKKGSAEELAAKIGSIEAQKRADLDNVNLTTSERRLKMVKADKDITDARRAFAVIGLDDEKSLIEAKISLSKKGSDDEFANQKDLLAKQLQISLSDINLSSSKRKALEAKYFNDLELMNKEHYSKRSTESIQAEMSMIEAQLANVQSGSNEEYTLKSELIEKKRALDVKEANVSIESESLKAAKIIEINANAVKEINDLTYAKRIEGINKVSEIQTLAASQEYIDGKTNKAQFEIDKLQITKDALKAEIAVNGEFSKDSIALKQQLADQEIALVEKTEETKKQVRQAAFDTFVQLGNAIMDGDKSRLQQQLSDLDHYYTTDVEAAKKNKDLKYISEKELNKKQLALKQEIAKADKKQAIFNVVMSTISAVAGMLSAKPIGPWNFILAALAGAQGAIQIAAIQNTPLPKYAKGRKGSGSGQGEMAWVGEQGPEIMYVPNGASIMPAGKSNKVRDAIGIMREYNIPVMPHISKSAMEEAKANGSGINYELLASKIGDQMEKRIRFPKMSGQRPVSINVDHSGTSVTEGDTTTHYRNRKYVGNV